MVSDVDADVLRTASAFAAAPGGTILTPHDRLDCETGPLFSKGILSTVFAEAKADRKIEADVCALTSSGPRLHFLESLVKASHAINGTLDPVRVAEVLATRTAELLDVPGVCVFQIDGDLSPRVTASRGLSEEYVDAQAGPLAQEIAGKALTEERLFATWDIRDSADHRLADAARKEGILAVVCAPMHVNGEPVGALSVHCHDQRHFNEDEFHVLSLLASQGAVALSNAATYGALVGQARDVRDGFQRVGEALATSLDIKETLTKIVELAASMTKADGGAIFLQEDIDKGGGLHLAAQQNLDRRSVRRFQHLTNYPLAEKAVKDGKPVVVTDTRPVVTVAFPNIQSEGSEIVDVRSVICIPVLLGGRAIGVLEVYWARTSGFSQLDLEVLLSFGSQAAVAIKNAKEYTAERSVAQTLQKAFLPELPPTIGGFEIGRVYAPASQVEGVGGDTYDLFTLPNGDIAAVIGDISGKGMRAATFGVMAKYTIRAYALIESSPARVLHLVNEAMVRQLTDTDFLTVSFARVDPKTRRATLASAAHPWPLHYCSATGVVSTLEETPGLFAGFGTNQHYDDLTIELGHDDILLFYTDGVTEARRGRDQFATGDQLERTLAANAHLPAQQIADSIHDAVVDWVGGPRADDIALLVLKAA